MIEKFFDVPMDEDTTILTNIPVQIGEHQALLQDWKWEGISGKSIIFASGDVVHLSDEEIKTLIQQSHTSSPISDMTITRSPAFVFVNFDFQNPY